MTDETCEFKPGDRVKCVQTKEPLLLNGEYTVQYVVDGKLYLEEWPTFAWYPCRFEYLEDATTEMIRTLERELEEERAARIQAESAGVAFGFESWGE